MKSRRVTAQRVSDTLCTFSRELKNETILYITLCINGHIGTDQSNIIRIALTRDFKCIRRQLKVFKFRLGDVLVISHMEITYPAYATALSRGTKLLDQI